MKITTANIKNPSYVENHEILVGTHTGSLKRIDVTDENPHRQTNVENLQSLTKTSRITTLDFGENDAEILVGRIEPVVKVYETSLHAFTSKHDFDHGPIVGAAKFSGKIIAGLENGKIQIKTTSSKKASAKSTYLETGDSMSRMRQCKSARNLIASGGKERQNNLKVWNLETNECVFRTKNVPNDFLQLEVPVWDTDFGFIDANCLSTCSRHGYIRVYDMRKQRRPVANYTNDKEQIAYTCLALHGDVVFSGTATGVMHAFDLRKMKHILHTYKGFTGSISDVGVDETGKYVYSASLDRFVRIHGSESTVLQYQCYVKSKATKILLRKCAPRPDIKEEDDSSDEEDETKGQTSSANLDEDDEDGDDDFDKLFDQMPTVDDEADSKHRKRKSNTSRPMPNPMAKKKKKKPQ